MPKIILNKKVFERLVGKQLPLEELKDRISMLGTDLERIEANEIEVEIFPNRPDMLSEQGFARAFSSFIGIKTGLKRYEVKKFGSQVFVKDLPPQWPYAVACIVKGIKFDDEKIREVIQLQEKLGTTFTRNRKKGGLGLYPLEKITFPVTFTGKDPDEIKFCPLEFSQAITGRQILSKHPKGREYGHLMESWKTYPVFVDSKGVIMSMPPIINSHDVGKIDETTTDVFIEGTGPDLSTITVSLSILVTSLADMGGEIYSLEIISPQRKFDFPNVTPQKMKLELNYINKRLGLQLKEKVAKELLERMGYGYENEMVLIPAYRADILHQVDLAEDIAIAYGYENFNAEIPQVATIGEEDKTEKFLKKVRDILVGLKLLEVKNYHLLTKEELTVKMNLQTEVVAINNALGDYNHLRNSLLPCLMKNLNENRHNEYPQDIFEIGKMFDFNDKEKTGVEERYKLAVILCHENADFTGIKQILNVLINALGLKCKVKEAEHPSYIAGRAGEIIVHDKKIGFIGEIAPKVIVNWNLSIPVAGLELDLEELFRILGI